MGIMRWLCRLTKPPGETGGIVLDPFAGSGTTLCACELEGRQWIGIEQDAGYAEIARARVGYWRREAERIRRQTQLGLFGGT